MDGLRTIMKYPGSKWRIADWIVGLMPEHKSYVEPFFGSGAVFFRKGPSRIETINDLDGDVVNLFQVVRDGPEALERALALTPYSRAEYDGAFAPADDPVEQARRFLIRQSMGYGSRNCYKAGWKNDVAGREYAYAARYWSRLPALISATIARLQNVQIENLPAVEVIGRFNRPDVLVYADPPYLLSTRGMKRQYTHEMTDGEHVELLQALRQHTGPVMLSGYDSQLYDDVLTGWEKLHHTAQAEGGVKRIETLWVNFEVQMRLAEIDHG